MKMSLTQLALRGTVALVVTAGLTVVGASILSDASAAPQRSQRSTPSLRLTRRSPVIVSAHGFRPRARVHVHVRIDATRTFSRTPKANRAGAFTVTFPVVIDRCSSWSISAAQALGPTAVLHGPVKSECAPASTP